MRKASTPIGDKFDYFLSEADQKINYWDSACRSKNPYNPYSMVEEFSITVLDEAAFLEIKSKMQS